jgi:nucleotide-binding universal stress UspA family protein
MTVIGADTTTPAKAASREPEPIASGESKPLRLIAVVDGSARTNRVVDFIAAIGRAGSAEVLVLNIQEKRDEARLRGYQTFKQGEVDDRLLHEVGAPIVNGVCRRLEKLGIATSANVLIGDPAEIVLQQAAAAGSQAVVIAAAPPSPVQRWLVQSLGMFVARSTAAQVAALAPIPVVTV